MKNPIALVYTDFHIKPETLDSVTKLCEEAIEIANNAGIKTHIWLGDIFDNRISQKMDVLNGLTSIIEKYDKRGHNILAIVGNHDKTDYNKTDSFLDAYKYHPSFDLINDLDIRWINELKCLFLPFFTDDILNEYILDFPKIEDIDILFGHFAVAGSRNNDRSVVENNIKPSSFKDFKKVYLGHYHDYQQVGSNIFHLGSLQQNNFGEDESKGFWMLYDDCTVELLKSKNGNVFKKERLDLDNIPPKQLKATLKKIKEDNPNSRLRIELWGKSSTLESFDKSEYSNLGIDFKKKHKDVELSIDIAVNEKVEKLSDSDIIEKFKEFCNENDYRYEEGLSILKQVLCQ